MTSDKASKAAADKGFYIKHNKEELKTVSEFSHNQEKEQRFEKPPKIITWLNSILPTIVHYTLLTILGLIIWGLLFVAWGDEWRWNGPWFRMALVVAIAWASGLVLESMTTLPPLLAALLTGILARNLGYLDMRHHTHIDLFLRKIYPVIILGKGSLAWDLSFMKKNWRQVAALGIAPWSAEVLTMTICMHFIFGHPWLWGTLLGTFYASVSCPVIMQTVRKVGSSPRRTHNWLQIVCTAGGTDTALSVGVYGLISTFLFSDDEIVYKYIRAGSTLLVAVVLGAAWGCAAGVMPHAQDYYVTELRVLIVVVGGLFANFFTLYINWGGVAGVAVLVCNATAAHYWAKSGWKLNNNPASVAYRVMWSACEPAVFAYTGTFLEIKSSMFDSVLLGFAILLICLIVRLLVAAATCWGMTLRERIFICCCWSTKSIVEAVLCPMTLNTLLMRKGTQLEMEHAEDILRLTILAILITTPTAFLLTKHLGPKLLRDKPHTNDAES